MISDQDAAEVKIMQLELSLSQTQDCLKKITADRDKIALVLQSAETELERLKKIAQSIAVKNKQIDRAIDEFKTTSKKSWPY